MARKLSLSPTPSAEQLSLPGIASREPTRAVTPSIRRPPESRLDTRSRTIRSIRGPTGLDPQRARSWRLPHGVEVLDEIVTCAIIVLIFLAIALPLFRWIAR